jgi:phosphonate transport system substrate-binding protein
MIAPTVRFGVEPYDTAARLVPIYQKVGELIGEKLGCKVEVFVATSYNAEIEAMRNGKLEIGEFGPLGCVLAHQVASRGGRRFWHCGRQAQQLLG